MAYLSTLLLVAQVVCAIAIIVLVLLQHGKGADMGAAFGSGASGSLFGATGSANFLSRTTAVMATLFFLATLGLSYAGSAIRTTQPAGGLMSTVPDSAPAKAPTVRPEMATDVASEPAKSATQEAPGTGTKPADIPK